MNYRNPIKNISLEFTFQGAADDILVDFEICVVIALNLWNLHQFFLHEGIGKICGSHAQCVGVSIYSQSSHFQAMSRVVHMSACSYYFACMCTGVFIFIPLYTAHTHV